VIARWFVVFNYLETMKTLLFTQHLDDKIKIGM